MNRMTRPVNEILAVAGFRDGLARRVVNLPTVKNLISGITLLCSSDSSVAAVTDHVENFLMFRRRAFTDEKRPGDVVVNGVR